MSSVRVEKVSELLLGFLGKEVSLLKDPRLELLTLTGVNMTPDLKRAHVFWSKIPLGKIVTPEPASQGSENEAPGGLPQGAWLNKKEIKEVSKALDGIKGKLRSKAGKSLSLKYVPEIIFEYDSSGSRADRVEAILDSIATEGE